MKVIRYWKIVFEATRDHKMFSCWDEKIANNFRISNTALLW